MPTGADNPTLDAFLRWVEARFGGEVSFAEPPTRSVEGFDNDIYFARLTGDALPDEWRRPLVLRVQPTAQRLAVAEREAEVYRFLRGLEYPVPRMLAVVPPDGVVLRPVQVMEQAPGKVMLKRMVARPWRIPAIVDLLASLHAQLHALSTDGWPFPEERDTSAAVPAERRLRLVHFVVEQHDSLGEQGMERALATVERHVTKLAVSEPSVVHGDLHPLNVLLDGSTPAVVDWTDASLGDPYADLSRMCLLFEAAAVGAPSAVVRGAMRLAGPRITRRFTSSYAARTGSPVDGGRLARWEPVQRLHDWARVALTAASDERAANMHPATLPWVRRECLRAVDALAT